MWLITGILIVGIPLVIIGFVSAYREQQYKKQHPEWEG
jgi:hypothetical protein